jgi:hypothetical protein
MSACGLAPQPQGRFRKKVADLQGALSEPAVRTGALEILRSLIEPVDVRARDNGIAIDFVGAIAQMISLSADAKSLAKEPYVSSGMLVAGTRTTFICLSLRLVFPSVSQAAAGVLVARIIHVDLESPLYGAKRAHTTWCPNRTNNSEQTSAYGTMNDGFAPMAAVRTSFRLPESRHCLRQRWRSPLCQGQTRPRFTR